MQKNPSAGFFFTLLLALSVIGANPTFADECPEPGYIKSDVLKIIMVNVYEREDDPQIIVNVGMPEKVDGSPLEFLWLTIPGETEHHQFMASLKTQIVNGQLEAWVDTRNSRIGDYSLMAAYMGSDCPLVSELELKNHPAIQEQLRCVEEKGYLQCLLPAEYQDVISSDVLQKLIDQQH